MNKSELRKKYLDIRKELPNKKEKSLIIKDKVLSLLSKHHVIGIYASMDDEVSTDELILELLKLSKVVVLPKIEDDHISFYQIASLDDLEVQGKYQIREPMGHNRPKEPIEAIIVPGISFDTKKNRLGFGKAYYDKYLSKLDIYKIGICFDELIVDELPTEEWDIKMDIVISDKRVVI